MLAFNLFEIYMNNFIIKSTFYFITFLYLYIVDLQNLKTELSIFMYSILLPL